MKKLILTIIFFVTIPVLISSSKYQPVRLKQKLISNLKQEPVKPVIKPDELIEALIQVESTGIENIHGDLHLKEGPSVGVLQIRPVMVREVNRILKILKVDKRFKMKDRYDREKSIEMFVIWRDFHHPDGDFETIARNWNGGPRGYLKPKTVKYWMKVQKELNKAYE
jgi:hypothetical protein